MQASHQSRTILRPAMIDGDPSDRLFHELVSRLNKHVAFTTTRQVRNSGKPPGCCVTASKRK